MKYLFFFALKIFILLPRSLVKELNKWYEFIFVLKKNLFLLYYIFEVIKLFFWLNQKINHVFIFVV